MDQAAVAGQEENCNYCGSLQCGTFCHASKLKIDSGQCQGMSKTVSIGCSTIGGVSRIWWCDIFVVGVILVIS